MGTAEIIATVNANPDIATAVGDADWIASLVESAQWRMAKLCSMHAFPTLSQGQVIGGTGATENLTALASGVLWFSVSPWPAQRVALDLSACTTGSNTAAELQRAIRALAPLDDTADWLFAEMSVSWSASAARYTVTSPQYGERSWVVPAFQAGEYHTAKAMKITPEYGAELVQGTDRNRAMEALCAEVVVEAWQYHHMITSSNSEMGDISGARARALTHAIENNRKEILGFRRVRI